MNYFKKYTESFCRKFFSVAAVLALIGLASCKKYLNVPPISGSTPEEIFKNVSTAQEAVLGVYQSLSGDQGYGSRLSLYYTVDNDETMGPTGNDDQDRRSIAHYHLLPNNAQLQSPYEQLYNGIEKANQCIYYIPKMKAYASGSPSDQLQLQRLYGEALTLRAQFYLELIRNWGDVPAPFLPSAYQANLGDPAIIKSNLEISKTNRDSIYDHILDDLALAETLVPWRGDPALLNIDERLTQGAVRGLRARIALYRGGFALRPDGNVERRSDYLKYDSIAMNECAVIMQSGVHTLNPSFKSVFKDYICAHKIDNTYGEVMFEVGAAGGASANDSKLGYYNGPRIITATTVSSTGTVTNTVLGNASLLIVPTYFYNFDSTDLRRDVTIAPYDFYTNLTKLGMKITAIRDGKFRRDWITPSLGTSQIQYFSVDWPILRYSDVLLMYAEARNELLGGPDQSTYDAINMVRRRGYGLDINAVSAIDLNGLDQVGFSAAIKKERSLELGAEGIRKFDLNRWGILAQTLKSVRDSLTLIGNSVTRPAPYSKYATSMYVYNPSTTANPTPNAAGALAVDDYHIWANSFYAKAPSVQPANTTKVSWIGSGLISTFIQPSGNSLGFAGYFIPNKNELLPLPQHAIDANYNLHQDYGY